MKKEQTYVVDVTIVAVASHLGRVGRVRKIEEDEAAAAFHIVTGPRADRDTVAEFFVYHDVMRRANR